MKHVIVTGVSQGIGLQLVRKFLSIEDCMVIALGRNPNLVLSRTSGFDQQRLKVIYLDLNAPDFQELTSTIESSLDERIDFVVNNAGYLVNKAFLHINDEDLELSVNINFKGPFKLIQSLLPYLKEGSHVVNITSMGAITGTSKYPGLAAYSSTKGSLSILTELLAAELETQKITVNGLALGAVNTEMLQNAFPNYQAPTNPQEIAEFISLFTLSGSKFFNGKILPVSTSNP
jgi:3-oxoacyl-[acyl-carrier protein] reductase